MTDTIEHVTDLDALADAAATRIASWLGARIEAAGDASLVLAGGSTPRRLYEVLAERAGSDGIAWDRVTVLFGDERAVDADSPDSNFKLADESLLSKLDPPPRAVHRIPGELGSTAAADAYEPLVPATLDVVLLGLGEDGHTASLFPGRPEIDERDRRVTAAYGPKPPPERVSLTVPCLNSARHVAFLVSGGGKRKILASVLDARSTGRVTVPSTRIKPTDGEVVFFVDADAR